MPKTYRTTQPEINRKLFPEGLPSFGVTLVTGPAKSGKTTLVIDIVRETLSTPGDSVLVLTEEPTRWQRAISLPNLFIRSAASGDDLDITGLKLIVVDGGAVSAPVIGYAQHGSVLVTSNSMTVQAAFARSSVLTLRVDRHDEGHSKVTVVKDRSLTNGGDALFKIDPILGLVASDYQAPEIKSAWDRLLNDEDLV